MQVILTAIPCGIQRGCMCEREAGGQGGEDVALTSPGLSQTTLYLLTPSYFLISTVDDV